MKCHIVYCLAQFGIVFSCCEHVCCRRFCQVQHCPLSAAFVCLPFLFLPRGASFPLLLALAHVKRTCCVPPLLCSDLCRGQAFLSIGVAFALCCLGTQFRKSVCLSRLFTKSKFFILLSVLIQGLSRKLKADAIKDAALSLAAATCVVPLELV